MYPTATMRLPNWASMNISQASSSGQRMIRRRESLAMVPRSRYAGGAGNGAHLLSQRGRGPRVAERAAVKSGSQTTFSLACRFRAFVRPAPVQARSCGVRVPRRQKKTGQKKTGRRPAENMPQTAGVHLPGDRCRSAIGHALPNGGTRFRKPQLRRLC
jgi:hypothetical protein